MLAQTRHTFAGTVGGVDEARPDEARAVLERLERIRQLDEASAPPALLLDELRALVGEAERWTRAEGDARARAATLELAELVTRVEEVSRETVST
jgi:hypothetical protein